MFKSFSLLILISMFMALANEQPANAPIPSVTPSDEAAPYAIDQLPDEGKTTEEWKQAAERSDLPATLMLANYWLHKAMDNAPGSPDYKEAFIHSMNWLNKAAAFNHPVPKLYLELLQHPDLDIQTIDSAPDSVKPLLKETEKLAQQGDSYAIVALCQTLPAVNPETYKKWIAPIKKRAEKNDPHAQTTLAELLCISAINTDLYNEGVSWAKKAYEQGDIQGKVTYGTLLLRSTETAESTIGERILLAEAQRGHAGAAILLISTLFEAATPEIEAAINQREKQLSEMLCNRGQLDYLLTCSIPLIEENKDVARGLAMLQRAADQGSFEALRLMCKYYEDNSYNVPTDQEKTLQAARILCSYDDPRGLINMAKYYEQGFGVQADGTKALEYIQRAKEQHCQEAEVEYARMMLKGIGMPANPIKAYELLTRLDNQDVAYPALYFLLGYMNEEGIGTEKNLTKALDYYTQGANIGDCKAMNNLASMYESGTGTPVNMKKAEEWYTRAAQFGNKDGVENLKRLLNAKQSPK